MLILMVLYALEAPLSEAQHFMSAMMDSFLTLPMEVHRSFIVKLMNYGLAHLLPVLVSDLQSLNQRHIVPACVTHFFLVLCVGINCGYLDTPTNGKVVFDTDTKLGSSATFSCRRGFKLVGDQVRVCQASGDWSLSQPSCESM